MLIYSILPNPQSTRFERTVLKDMYTQRFSDAIVENSFDCLGSLTLGYGLGDKYYFLYLC